MPTNFQCERIGCGRPADTKVTRITDTGAELDSAYYCGDFHLVLIGFRRWSATGNASVAVRRLYKTASGLLDKLAEAVEKEWASTAPEKQ